MDGKPRAFMIVCDTNEPPNRPIEEGNRRIDAYEIFGRMKVQCHFVGVRGVIEGGQMNQVQ